MLPGAVPAGNAVDGFPALPETNVVAFPTCMAAGARAGRRASVPVAASVLPGVSFQLAGVVVVVVRVRVASATAELAPLWVVAARVQPAGAAAVCCQPALPMPPTSSSPGVLGVSAGAVSPLAAEVTSSGRAESAPEKAAVTMLTWVAGLMVAVGLGSPVETVLYQAARRVLPVV